VRLADSAPVAKVRGFDLVWNEPGRTGFRSDRLTQWKFECAGRKRIVAREVQPTGAIGKTLNFGSQVTLETPAGFLSLDGRPYRETLHVYAGMRGCEFVNEVNLENYLDGLVNSEISAKWEESAIAAQVVAARTYAYHRILQARRRIKFATNHP
jgi:hypothetical protein